VTLHNYDGAAYQYDAVMPMSYKFTGKERDAESGLDYFSARYYSSGYGRFLSPDEFTGGPVDAFSASDPLPPGPLPYADITNPQSLNKYAYTLNNPLRYTDPDGHGELDFWLGVAHAVATNFAFGAGRQESYNSDNAAGQAVGDAISVVVGAVEVVAGAAAVVGGSGEALVTAPAGATGVGVVVPAAGVATAVAGAAVATHGVGMAASGAAHLAENTKGKTGEVYVSEPQQSGKPYVGRTTQGTEQRMSTRTDGRTGKARVVDRYDAKNTREGRFKEQKQIDKRGGVRNLDNKRNEVSKKNMKKLEKEFQQ
jgi:RHS repeat-associated protein